MGVSAQRECEMYGEVPVASIVPPVVATGTAIVLPMTGVDTLTNFATAIGAGLVTWAAVYLYMAKFSSFKG